MNDIQVKEILELVKEIDSESPIDWAMLSIDESNALELMANNLLDQYKNTWINLSERERVITMLSVMTHLLVENFTLHLKLRIK